MNLPRPCSFAGCLQDVDDYGVVPLLMLGLVGTAGAVGVAGYGIHRLTAPSPSGEGPLQTIAKSGQQTIMLAIVAGAILYFALQKIPARK